MLYVRTERRPGGGVFGVEGREHVFVTVDAEKACAMNVYVPEGDPLPEGMELVYDPAASERFYRLERELRDFVRQANAELGALTEAMKRAVAVCPPEVASELRRVYRETLGDLLTRSA
jgi:hypothetical protein